MGGGRHVKKGEKKKEGRKRSVIITSDNGTIGENKREKEQPLHGFLEIFLKGKKMVTNSPPTTWGSVLILALLSF